MEEDGLFKLKWALDKGFVQDKEDKYDYILKLNNTDDLLITYIPLPNTELYIRRKVGDNKFGYIPLVIGDLSPTLIDIIISHYKTLQ